MGFSESHSGVASVSNNRHAVLYCLGLERIQLTEGIQIMNGHSDEPQRVITVRLSKSLHEKVVNKAHDERTSMNQFCISKLTEAVQDDPTPDASPDQPASGSEVNRPTPPTLPT